MKFSRYLFGLILTISVSCVAVAPSLGQSSLLEVNRKLASSGSPAQPPGAVRLGRLPVEATASIDFGNGQSFTATCRKGVFDRVGVRHDQAISIAIQYSTADAGKTITVEPLDGGQVVTPAKNLVVAADGTIRFTFRVGHTPGTYQVALRNGTKELGLQFWVTDDANPRNNPPVANAAN